MNSESEEEELTLREALCDKKFWILICIAYLSPMYIIYLNFYMKLIFMPIINDDHYLAACAIIVTISAFFAAPFWGYLGDKFHLKQTLLLLSISDLFFKSLGIFCQQKWNLIVLYFLLSFHDKGFVTIISPGLIQIFGL